MSSIPPPPPSKQLCNGYCSNKHTRAHSVRCKLVGSALWRARLLRHCSRLRRQLSSDANFASTTTQVTDVFWCTSGLPHHEILTQHCCRRVAQTPPLPRCSRKTTCTASSKRRSTSRTRRSRTLWCECTATTCSRSRCPATRSTCCGGRSQLQSACSARCQQPRGVHGGCVRGVRGGRAGEQGGVRRAASARVPDMRFCACESPRGDLSP